MKIETTTNGNNYRVHEITVDDTHDEFFRIHLGRGRELTLDTSYNQVYYRLHEAVEVQATLVIRDELGLDGVLEFNCDCDKGTTRVTGIEIIP